MKMNVCKLCENEISNYNVKFNHLKIDESCERDICSNCVEKIMNLEQRIYADLFPTKFAKKRFEKK